MYICKLNLKQTYFITKKEREQMWITNNKPVFSNTDLYKDLKLSFKSWYCALWSINELVNWEI